MKTMAKQMKKDVDMLNGSLFKAVINFTIPLIATNVLSHLFNIADMIVVGRFCGSKCAGAIGSTSSIVGLIVNISLGLASGTGVLVAQKFGAGDDRGVKDTVHTAVYTALFVGIITMVIGVTCTRGMLVLMNAPADLLPLSALYLRIYFAGIILRLMYLYGAAILRALGDSQSPFKYLTLGGILNVVFNIFFVTVCEMNVDGVAYGTLISEGVSGFLCLATIMRRKDAACFRFGKLREHFKFGILKEMLKLGIPAGVEQSMYSISSIIIQTVVNGFGSVVVTGNSAATSIGNITFLAVKAYGTAASNFMAQNYGAKKYQRMKKLQYACLAGAGITMAILGSLSFIFANELITIYIKDSPEAMAFGVIKLRIILIGFIFGGIHQIYNGLSRGLGKSFSLMIISLGGICGVRILCTVLMLKIYYSPIVIFLSFPISYFITMVVSVIYNKIIMRKIENQARCDAAALAT